jgi:hypothetical protein
MNKQKLNEMQKFIEFFSGYLHEINNPNSFIIYNLPLLEEA